MTTKQIEVRPLGQLKDHFPESLFMQIDDRTTGKDILKQLTAKNPSTENILRVSRVADNRSLLAADETIGGQETLFILPPSSGG